MLQDVEHRDQAISRLILLQEFINTGVCRVQTEGPRDLDLRSVEVDARGSVVAAVAQEIEKLTAAAPDVQDRRGMARGQPSPRAPAVRCVVLGERMLTPYQSPGNRRSPTGPSRGTGGKCTTVRASLNCLLATARCRCGAQPPWARGLTPCVQADKVAFACFCGGRLIL